MLSEKTFIEVMDILFEALYIDGELHEMNIDVFLTDYAKLELTHAEKWLFIQQLRKSGLGYQVHTEDGDFKNRLTLSEEALEIIYSHGSYSNYISEIKEKENAEQIRKQEYDLFERKGKIIQNRYHIITTCAGIASIILALIALFQQSYLNQLQHKLQKQSNDIEILSKEVKGLKK